MKLSSGCEIFYIGTKGLDGLFFEGEIGDIRSFYEECLKIAEHIPEHHNNQPMTFRVVNPDKQVIFIRFANGRYFIGRFIESIC